MSKIMQKIVLFIEPSGHAFETPLKIGNLFMNRFAVDEDGASEILKIFELDKTSFKMAYPDNSEYGNFEEERKQKGMDLIIKIGRLVRCRIINGNVTNQIWPYNTRWCVFSQEKIYRSKSRINQRSADSTVRVLSFSRFCLDSVRI